VALKRDRATVESKVKGLAMNLSGLTKPLVGAALGAALGAAIGPALGATPHAQAPPVAGPTSEPGVSREVVVEQKNLRVTRAIRDAGSVEAPGTHAMDVLIIPTSDGTAEVSVQGKNLGAWKVGQVFHIPRDAEHYFANTGKTPLRYIAISVF
jgi:quercetin dioxygenase-like cupin family protein